MFQECEPSSVLSKRISLCDKEVERQCTNKPFSWDREVKSLDLYDYLIVMWVGVKPGWEESLVHTKANTLLSAAVLKLVFKLSHIVLLKMDTARIYRTN